MTDITFIGLDVFQAKLAALPDALDTTLSAKMQALSQTLADKVRGNLSGDVLQSRSGALMDSVKSAVEDTGTGMSASVSAGHDVPYAAIQEYGGQTRAHVIEAVSGKALAFAWAGKQSFFAHVNHPGSNIPARSYMGSALDDMQGDIVDGMGDALAEAINA